MDSLEKRGQLGSFLMGSQAYIDKIAAGKGLLPDGIEVQILDLGYETYWGKNKGKPADWLTSHGDVFPTKPAKMESFPPAEFKNNHLRLVQ